MKCHDAKLIQDIWYEVLLEYALLGEASIAFINFLFMTHNKRWESMPFDFVDTIQRLTTMGNSAQFVRDVIRAQRTQFPRFFVDWQQIVTQSMGQVPIGMFLVLVEASISVHQ